MSFFKSKIEEEKKGHAFEVMNIEWARIMNVLISCGKNEEILKIWYYNIIVKFLKGLAINLNFLNKLKFAI